MVRRSAGPPPSWKSDHKFIVRVVTLNIVTVVTLIEDATVVIVLTVVTVATVVAVGTVVTVVRPL